MIALDDHTLKLGFDMTAVNKGFEDIERRFRKLKSPFDSTASSTTSNSTSRPPSSAISQGERDRGLANLDATNLKAKQQIEALRKVGSEEARSKIMALEAAVKRLKVAEDGLKNSTKTTDKAFISYKKTLRDTKNQINSMSKSTNTLARKFNATKFAANGLTSSLKNLGRSWISVFAIGAGIIQLKNVAAEMENIGVASLLSSGNAKKAAKDLIFVGDLTERLGLRYKDTAKAFATFNVGAISGGVDPEEAKDVFIKISEGLASAGTNAESAKLAFLGFRQMISGTVVQAQEINQIVDQVPAFSGAAVKALEVMGVSGKDHLDKNKKSFKDTIKTAGVDAKEFTKIVAAILSDQGKSSGALEEYMQSITAVENRMVNAANKAVEKVSKGGLEDVFKTAFQGIREVILAVTPALQGLAFALKVVAETIAFPFRMIDKLGMALGMSEGEGLHMAIRGLITILLMRFVPALATTTKALWGIVTGSLGAASSLLGVGTGAKGASKGVKVLTTSVKSLMRALWPLLAVELAISIFDYESRKNYDDLIEAAKTFTEEQAKANEEIKKSGGLTNFWLRGMLRLEGRFNKVVGYLKRMVGYFQILANLEFGDLAKSAGIGALRNLTPAGFFMDDIKSPFNKEQDRNIEEGRRRAREITAGATVTNHYNINGDPETVRQTIEESMSRYVPDYMQTVYSGGG